MAPTGGAIGRHVVVVEDDDQAGIHRAGIVHGLIGHACGHRSVADHGDDVVFAARQVARNGHAEAGRDRGGRMRSAERIVFALATLGEAGETAGGAQGADTVAATGENLVRVGLVADVPDDAVTRRIEDVVECGGQFDHAETCTEVAASDGHCVDGLLAQLVGDLTNLLDLELAQIFRCPDRIEQRGLTKIGHGIIPI